MTFLGRGSFRLCFPVYLYPPLRPRDERIACYQEAIGELSVKPKLICCYLQGSGALNSGT